MSLKCDVYLVHYEPLKERLTFMQEQFERFGIKANVISTEPEAGWIKDEPEIRKIKQSKFQNNLSKSVSKAEESLAWKHYAFIEKASQGTQPALVLEDDAILDFDFVNVVNKIVVTNDWDVIFPGSGCNLRLSGQGLIRVPHPASKCTDSYILTPSSAKKLYSTMKNGVSLAIDWELNYQMMIHDLRVCWLEPPIVRQGSQDGTWTSSINGKKENLYK